MRFEKIIFLRYIPLTEKIYRDFNMQAVIDAGIRIEYWDFTSLFFEHSFEQEDSSHLVDSHKFTSYADLEASLATQDIDKILFLSIVTYEYRVAKLYKLLTKYNCTLGVFGRNTFPMYHLESGSKQFYKRLLRITPRKLYNYFRSKCALRLKLNGTIKGYDIIFQGGAKGWKGVGVIDPSEVNKAEVININSDDYDNYLRLRNSPRLIEGQYILFLDEYLPLHPDTKLFGNATVDPNDYYPALNAYFDRVEAQFNMPVVIAAHPKALKYKENDYFNGRSLYYGKSAELSRDAEFVIAHDSTSINYPIAFGVRLHFITSHSIETIMRKIHCNVTNFASYTGCNWQYFDNPNEPVNVIATVSQERYQSYKYDFQCSKETENRLTKDIFIEFIKGGCDDID